MATITKTQGTVALTHQAITHPATAKGSEIDVSTKLAGTFYLYHCSVEAAANTNPGIFLIQSSGSASGNEDWVTMGQFTASATTADTETLASIAGEGVVTLPVASTTGFFANDYLYIQDPGTLADSEWARCQKINANTSIILIDGLTNAKDASDVVWNDADLFVVPYDFTSIGRVRVVFQHEGAAGANVHVKAFLVTGDSIG